MDALAVGAEIGGIIAGLAILVSFGLWVTRKVRALINTQRREHEQLQQVTAQLAKLSELVQQLQASYAEIVAAQERDRGLTQALADNQRDDRKDLWATIVDDQKTINSVVSLSADYFKLGETHDHKIRDIEGAVAELQQHVEELSKGYWPRVGGTHKTG